MAHSHGLTTHAHFHEQDPGWLSFTLRSGAHQDIDALRGALERVAEAEPLLRCKGFALSNEDGCPVLLQGVRTRVVTTVASSNQTLQPPTRELLSKQAPQPPLRTRLQGQPPPEPLALDPLAQEQLPPGKSLAQQLPLEQSLPEQSPQSSELVFIGYHLSRSRVAAALSRLTSTVWS
jgi:G3E family GTPase